MFRKNGDIDEISNDDLFAAWENANRLLLIVLYTNKYNITETRYMQFLDTSNMDVSLLFDLCYLWMCKLTQTRSQIR